MSLPSAARGAKAHLQAAWSADEFDLERACRAYGRNDAFWAFCYWTLLNGHALPTKKQARGLVRRANQATGGLNRHGERERYTLYEAMTTIDQVEGYRLRSGGLKRLAAARRHWIASSRSKHATPGAKALLEAIVQVAEKSARAEEFTASHRQLAEMAGLGARQVASLLHSLRKAKQVTHLGFTPARNGQRRGTTRLSLRPMRPLQYRDEKEPPQWNELSMRWEWSTPLARGVESPRWRWLARQGLSSAAANVPNVYCSLRANEKNGAFALRTPLDKGLPSRGSP